MFYTQAQLEVIIENQIGYSIQYIQFENNRIMLKIFNFCVELTICYLILNGEVSVKYRYLMFFALLSSLSYSVLHTMNNTFANQPAKEFLEIVESYVKLIHKSGDPKCISDLARSYSGTIIISEQGGTILAMNIKPIHHIDHSEGLKVVPYRGTALINAIKQGCVYLAQDLIAAKVDVNETDELGISPLSYAIKNEYIYLAKNLIAAGAR